MITLSVKLQSFPVFYAHLLFIYANFLFIYAHFACFCLIYDNLRLTYDYFINLLRRRRLTVTTSKFGTTSGLFRSLRLNLLRSLPVNVPTIRYGLFVVTVFDNRSLPVAMKSCKRVIQTWLNTGCVQLFRQW